ncbi:MAG: protein-methionine-sulfoxide reductase heme-binding subunit MsrQ [Anaerolineales bacterium]|nr:protein-methionine-sulfoxide reductase heme-binding subunit MsrQ [Anaerolineales bacterium]
MLSYFRSLKFTKLQILAHSAAWLLAGWLIWDAWAGNLSVNPIQAATQRTGKYALIFLIASLACTPLNTLLGIRQALSARRALGIYAFLFAAAHFAIFIWIDYGFQWEFIRLEILDKKYILAGAATLSILTPLAATSFRWWKKKLGKRWKRLHQLVYLAAPLAILHYSWAKKGDLFRLQGDILQPLSFGMVVTLLLVMRIPVVRRSASRLRQELQRRFFSPATPGSHVAASSINQDRLG